MGNGHLRVIIHDAQTWQIVIFGNGIACFRILGFIEWFTVLSLREGKNILRLAWNVMFVWLMGCRSPLVFLTACRCGISVSREHPRHVQHRDAADLWVSARFELAFQSGPRGTAHWDSCSQYPQAQASSQIDNFHLPSRSFPCRG